LRAKGDSVLMISTRRYSVDTFGVLVCSRFSLTLSIGPFFCTSSNC